MKQDPNLYVLAAPSGGGKTSLIAALMERDKNICLSVSHTTRPPRAGEIDGKHYHFVDKPGFEALTEIDAFLEYAHVFDYSYGTGRQAVMNQLAKGFDVMLDIDWQGAQQVREKFPACCSIYLLPPSIQELNKRLSGRGQDSPEIVARRMRQAQSEISHWADFDFLVINDHFDKALNDVHSIIRHRRPKRSSQKKRFAALLAELMENV
jgi:guanylate kinase